MQRVWADGASVPMREGGGGGSLVSHLPPRWL